MEDVIKETYGNVFEKDLLDEIVSVAQLVEFNEGDVLIDIGKYIKTMPLLIRGAIKIMREDFDTGELLLYFIEKGDTCSMTLNCCLGDKKSEIRAVAENNGMVAMIPVNKMEEWLAKYKSWRAYVFESYNNRFNEMLAAIDNIAFMNMNERLLNYLHEKSKINQSNIISKTHQEIAYELNSSRVVVSRLLKALENEGHIKLNRNTIELIK
ncbi:Crp/Fnr family transcriptional regulator [Flavobacterium sp. CBA20B-1]|uniref:Crp/Fnr family transcriptional regulator n=1 Tax=unclassified Flavobacterium TaxID=196869 RepID=UPI0022258EA9|nr:MULTISPECIES: Crp/Fnr family transcriptional regulator [unclassified Flavobacterium]WCM42942.1 Crp/Fnr family transcriptional regulator [Flavobacterium sp. CBA20B-1]